MSVSLSNLTRWFSSSTSISPTNTKVTQTSKSVLWRGINISYQLFPNPCNISTFKLIEIYISTYKFKKLYKSKPNRKLWKQLNQTKHHDHTFVSNELINEPDATPSKVVPFWREVPWFDLHWFALLCVAWFSFALMRCFALHCFALLCIALHGVALLCLSLRGFT